MERKRKREKHFVRKSTAIGLTAASMGAVVVMAAAAGRWTRGMQNNLQGTTEQMQELENKGMVAFPDLSVTRGGVTVSVDQCVVNGSWGHVALRVSGYALPEGKDPNFETADLTIEDYAGAWSISGGFDDGLQTDGFRVIGKDGLAPETETDGSLKEYWQDENGDLEYVFSIYIDNPEDGSQSSLSGRTVTIDLAGLGYDSGKCEIHADVHEKWHFSFALPESDELLVYDNLEKSIGDTDAVLQSVEISPISIAVTYDFPRKPFEETGYREELITEANGTQHEVSTPFTYTEYEEPPYLSGVKMDDGTVLLGINAGPGAQGYLDETGDTWVHRFGTGKILEADKIAALLFLDKDTLPESESDVITEDNCFEVPLR